MRHCTLKREAGCTEISDRILRQWVVNMDWNNHPAPEVFCFPHFFVEIAIVQTGLNNSAVFSSNTPLLPGHAQPPATCDRCAVTFSTLGIMLKHRAQCDGELSVDKSHHIKTMPSVTEPTVSITKRRTREETDPAKPFVCPICHKAFAKHQHLSSHRPVHTKEKAYTCHQCNKKFSRISNLREHERIHLAASYPCPYCNSKFKQSNNRQAHMMSHTQTGPYDCLYCQEKFTRFAQLSEHLKKSHAGRVKTVPVQSSKQMKKKGTACEVCKKVFTVPESLKAHRLVHSGERPYQCPRCPKKFRSMGHLTSHMSTHTGVKAYGCHWCHKQFSQARSLRTHVYTHNIDKPFVCDNCQEQFATYRELVVHRMRHRQRVLSSAL